MKLEVLEPYITEIEGKMKEHGNEALRYSLAIVYIWFGALKPLGLSPAEELVTQTLPILAPETALLVIGLWEVAIGVCLAYKPLLRVGLVLLFLHLPGILSPMILLPEVAYTQFPHGLTLEGQYVVKNIVTLAVGIVLAGKLYEKPD